MTEIDRRRKKFLRQTCPRMNCNSREAPDRSSKDRGPIQTAKLKPQEVPAGCASQLGLNRGPSPGFGSYVERELRLGSNNHFAEEALRNNGSLYGASFIVGLAAAGRRKQA
jgi:hypothetical protein